MSQNKTGSEVTCTTPTFRCSYPNIFKAKKNDLNGKDEFSMVALFAKGADLTAVKNAANAAVIKKWGADKEKWPKGLKSPFRDQAEKEKEGKMPEGHEKGAFFITLKAQNRPTVVDQAMNEILEPSKIYAGCYARASIAAYAYDQKGNKGVAFGLNHVQLVKDGEPISGRPSVSDAFQPIAVEEGAAQSASDLF